MFERSIELDANERKHAVRKAITNDDNVDYGNSNGNVSTFDDEDNEGDRKNEDAKGEKKKNKSKRNWL